MDRSKRKALDKLLMHFGSNDCIVMKESSAMDKSVSHDINGDAQLSELLQHRTNSDFMRFDDRHALILEGGTAVRSLPSIESVLDERRLGGLCANTMALALQNASQLSLLLSVPFRSSDLTSIYLA